MIIKYRELPFRIPLTLSIVHFQLNVSWLSDMLIRLVVLQLDFQPTNETQ